MKYILIVLSIFLVGGVLLGYTLTELSPIVNGVLVHKNLAIVLGMVFVVFGSFFALVNMIINQVVSKEVKLNDALRRGLLFGLLVTGLLGMKAIGILSIWLGALLTFAIVVLEVIVMEMRK